MSLYNELRPTMLSQVEGQHIAKQQLLGMFKSKRIPNALLFTGPRGTGKTTVARIVARTINCEMGGEEPCGKCSSCRSILDGHSFDVIELDAASNSGIGDVKEIIGNAQYVPMSKYRVFILDEVHVFSSNAWAALLKILEEPPENTVFIMCTTEDHKVPKTIVSRSRRVQFEAISLDVITDYMARVCNSAGKSYEMDALRIISIASEGGMRDALSILEPFYDDNNIRAEAVFEALGTPPDGTIFNILNAVNSLDACSAINEVRNASGKGINIQMLIKGIITALTNSIFLKNGVSIDSIVATENYKAMLSKYASSARISDMMNMSKVFSNIYASVIQVSNPEFLLETVLLSAISNTCDMGKIADLEKRVVELESRTL